MKIIERWREQLQSKYRLILNGHDGEEARGGEKEFVRHTKDLPPLDFSGLWEKSCSTIFIGTISMLSRCCKKNAS